MLTSSESCFRYIFFKFCSSFSKCFVYLKGKVREPGRDREKDIPSADLFPPIVGMAGAVPGQNQEHHQGLSYGLRT